MTLADYIIDVEKKHPECDYISVITGRFPLTTEKQVGGLISNSGADYTFICGHADGEISQDKLKSIDVGSNPEENLIGGIGLFDWQFLFLDPLRKLLGSLGFTTEGINKIIDSLKQWWWIPLVILLLIVVYFIAEKRKLI